MPSDVFINSNVSDDKIAIVDEADNSILTYGDLRNKRNNYARAYKENGKSLAFYVMRNKSVMAEAFLTEIGNGDAIALINPDLPIATIAAMIEIYQPYRVVGIEEDIIGLDISYSDCVKFGNAFERIRKDGKRVQVHDNLALLLATSGTTGSIKFVRLSTDNLVANAADIIDALSINENERAIGHLPLHYSFGYSVLITHMIAGGSVLLTELGLMGGALWRAAREFGATSLSGVPSHIEILSKLSIERLKLDTLKSICQAGGRGSPQHLEAINNSLRKIDGKLYVMYGQTEAAPRITTLPAAEYEIKPKSVGPSLKSGRLSIINSEGNDCKPNEIGEVVYEGPNVMMGYAECAADLGLGDIYGNRLITGDLGYLDADGYLYLTGRTARFAKVAGLRISLDEIERIAGNIIKVACVDGGNAVIIAINSSDVTDEFEGNKLLDMLYKQTSAPLNSYKIIFVQKIPLKSNGKIDYKGLEEMINVG